MCRGCGWKQWQEWLNIVCSIEVSGLTDNGKEVQLTAATHAHAHCHVDILTLSTPVSSDFPGWQQCLTSLSGLEWGPRHLGPNQSIRTNAGRATGWALLRCVLWRTARHTAVLLKLCDRTWEVKANWLADHMLKRCFPFKKGIIVEPLFFVLLFRTGVPSKYKDFRSLESLFTWNVCIKTPLCHYKAFNSIVV